MPRSCRDRSERFNTKVPSRFLDVREHQITIFIGAVDDLIELGDGVTHVLCVGQRFFALSSDVPRVQLNSPL
jgi:hypothetical protein